MLTRDASIAADRFGFGARPGELEEIGSDPRGWLKGQLKSSAVVANDLPSSATGLTKFFEDVAKRKELAQAARRNQDAATDIGKMIAQGLRGFYIDEVVFRTRQAVITETPFLERLVQFWSNHFTVSAKGKLITVPTVGAFEREAIRPHVTGRFIDMLMAVEKHPAMLTYLDNYLSFGPNSRIGKRRDRGLNENLGREIMELHTVGVNAGYTQADVTNFAKVLTGWTIVGPRRPFGEKGTFQFVNFVHEPGPQTVMGKVYDQDGMAQGEAVLHDLAYHPATAQHVATKLVSHFVADDPPKPAVDRIAMTFRDTGGDLAAVSAAIVDLNEAWAEPFQKVKSPNDFILSTLRGLKLNDLEPKKTVGLYILLGQQPFFAPSPAGWPDTAADWMGPDAVKKRLDLAETVGRKIGTYVDPRQLAEALLGPVLSAHTQEAVARAASGAQGFALLLMSPEFQRR